MSLYINSQTQKTWNSLCEFYDSEQRSEIISDIEMLIEKTALEREIPLSEEDDGYKELNKKISMRYVRMTYGIALYYLHKFPDSTEIPVISFTYEELFQEELEKPADPSGEQPG